MEVTALLGSAGTASSSAGLFSASISGFCADTSCFDTDLLITGCVEAETLADEAAGT
jgi:hypothetical protein